MNITELQKRYDVLFRMYVEHIHEHRLGVGKTCEDCVQLANKEIDNRLAKGEIVADRNHSAGAVEDL